MFADCYSRRRRAPRNRDTPQTGSMILLSTVKRIMLPLKQRRCGSGAMAVPSAVYLTAPLRCRARRQPAGRGNKRNGDSTGSPNQ
jgi:hypothetical protein